ncbi:protein kinase [Hypoxylon rubiginosum]|uniref:Protein kinase n=1 Tax=Hypoxylon rubiginosum TaxID=110542 RepID=A0ACC0D3F0_9PEZI|nr:protein kinase [Hypoxylon rubiginosum]
MASVIETSKKLGLDDPKGRVQPIYDRGEQLYRTSGHASQHHRATAPNEVLPTNSYELLDTIGSELDYAHVVSGMDTTKAYIPRDRLPNILTLQRVRAIVSLPCFNAYPDKNRLAADICFSRPKLLAVLIGIRKTHDFARFMADGVVDQCLPMVMNQTSSQRLLYCKFHNVYHDTINSYPRPDDRTQFSRWSYSLVAPHITCFSSKKHSHYILDPEDVFPMMAAHTMPRQEGAGIDQLPPAANAYGGFSEVHQVQIERSHYNFGDNIGVRHPHGLFALKKLTSHNRENFNLELSSLLFSMDNALKRRANKHLIQLLATFEVVDPAGLGSTYYLLFDWAEGNLTNFWRANQNLIGNRLHCQWMSQQFHEVSLALESVHNERLETLKSIDNNTLERNLNGRPVDVQELYGRHGDIKPDNFLWFHPRQPPDLLALCDFGLGRLHTQVSRSKQNPKDLTWTATYRAPEFDLPDGMISRASDIFSLGCVFLEHVTWFMRGVNSVEHVFPARRMDKDIHDFISDTFFTISSDPATGRQRPYLKPEVHRWISELQSDPSCSWYIHQLLDVIRDRMLEPDRTKRANIILLRKEMEKLRTTCQRNPSFYLKTKSEAASA